MKTLKTIIFSILFIASASVAMANLTTTKHISTTDDLCKVLKEKVEANFSEPSNFLNEKGVTKLYEDVEIIFFITPEQTIRLLSVNCQNGIATEYVKQLLNKQKLNVGEPLTGKMFRIDFKLNYRAV